MPSFTVQNVVASVSLHVDIPLEKVSATLKNTEYNPEQFPGLVLRLTNPKVSALLFSSGNIVCTGAKSPKVVKQTVQRIIKELSTIKIKVTKRPTIKVQNIVASGNLDLLLNLDHLVFNLESAEYEPEQFPGLVYKVPNSHITFLLFGTGKFVCTGAKCQTEIENAVKKLRITLKKTKNANTKKK